MANLTPDTLLNAVVDGQRCQMSLTDLIENYPIVEEVEGIDDLEAFVEAYDKDNLEAYCLYHDNLGGNGTSYSDFEDSYVGQFDDDEDFIESEFSEQIAAVRQASRLLASCLDFDNLWESDLRHDYWQQDGHYFRNI